MIGRSVGIAAACALGASAFLIPAGIESDGTLSTAFVNPKEQIITLPCSECAFPYNEEKVADADEEDLFSIQGGANNLVLNFTISEDGHSLQLNGREIYPAHIDMSEQSMYVKQVPAETGLVDIKSGSAQSTELEITAYGLEEAEMKPLGDIEGDKLHSVMLDIIGLENERIHLDEISIKLLKTDDGELLIMLAEIVPNQHPNPAFAWPSKSEDSPERHGPPHHGPPRHHKSAECDVLPAALCKFKAMIDSKIHHAMSHHRGGKKGGKNGGKKGGCKGGKGPHGDDATHLPTHIKPHFMRPGGQEEEEGRPNSHHGRPHHMRPHDQHHGHHGHHGGPSSHGFWSGFANGLVAVLIPIMAGVAVGMTVSIIGLVVGRTIGFLWIKLARGGRRGSASVTEDGESDSMLEKMEAPPVYEDAPAYLVDEKEQVVLVEEVVATQD